MKILTYNLWHGLTPTSSVSMEYLEPEARRRARLLMQLKVLKDLDFDLGFFQEVNPLLERASQFENEIKMTDNYQSDLVGVKLLGVGLPSHLNSGLLTLGKDKFNLRRVKGAKLSGHGRSFVSPWLSFQLQEERYALLSELLHPDWGRVLVVNLHLHHGLELTEALSEALHSCAEELGFAGAVEHELLDRLQKGNERRFKELKKLMDDIRLLGDRYSMVILGGDFNARSEGELGQLLKEYGFVDSFSLQSEVSELNTYDRERNYANHRLQERFPLSIKFEDLSFSKKVNLKLKELFTRHEWTARRIDQIWIKGEKSKKWKSKVSLIGVEGEDGFAPSDHFGYLVSLEETL